MVRGPALTMRVCVAKADTAGKVAATAAAPNPLINSRRSIGRMRSAMKDADHFPLDMSSCRSYSREA
jgi:hypothetical protein